VAQHRLNRGGKQAENSRSDEIDKDDKLWWLILRTRRAMRKARSKELLQYGVTPEEAAVLIAANKIGHEATPSKISRWLLREPHSTSGILIRMEKEGLVRKVKDLDKRNLVRVTATEKGQQAYYNVSQKGVIQRIVSALSGEERKQLRTCLDKIQSAALKEAGIASKPPFPPYD